MIFSGAFVGVAARSIRATKRDRGALVLAIAAAASAVTHPAVADPVPVVRTGGVWAPNPSATFPVADVTLDLRRFAKIPNEGAFRTQMLGLRYVEGDDRLFVVSGSGGNNVYAIAPDGSTVATIFQPRPAGLRGIRDVVFHPEFYQVGAAGYGKLYTIQDVVKPANPAGLNYLGDSSYTFGDGVLSEWTAQFNGQGTFTGVDSNSYRELFRIAQIRGDHSMGQATFNPFAQPGDADYGLLYLSHGDSYGFLDGDFTAQRGDVGLGKILRINPLQSGANAYTVPASNPFVSNPAILDEIYSLGHRNNHNISFAQDAQGNAHLLVAEIGENSVEEINLVSQPGGNFGWSDREGTIELIGGDTGVSEAGFIYPVAQYGHDGPGRHGVAGGYVVDNGSELQGQYVFADFPTSGDAMTFSFSDALQAVTTGDPATAVDPADISSVNVRFDHDDNVLTPMIASSLGDVIRGETSYDNSGRLDVRFGQGPRGELYVFNKRNGWVYQVVNSLANDPADFDGDYDVDADDLVVWKAGGATTDVADSDGDGDSDGADFLAWQRARGVDASATASGASVPEPAAGSLLGLASAALARRRRRR